MEQKHGHPCDTKNDVYSMGVVLSEIITGKKFQDVDKRITGKNPRESYIQRLKLIGVSSQSETLKSLVGYCLHWCPKERPSAEMVNILFLEIQETLSFSQIIYENYFKLLNTEMILNFVFFFV